MKSGIVMSVKGTKAILLRPDGNFVTVRALPGWKKGDAVSWNGNMKKKSALRFRTLAAACLLLLLLAGLGGTVGFTRVTLVSIDVNPSVELGLNRLNRVVSFRSYNKEGEEILERSGIRFQKLEDALEALFADGFLDYLERSPYLTYTVQSQDTDREMKLTDGIEALTQEILSARTAAAAADVEIYQVDEEYVEQAHEHHVTAGKYMALLELQQVAPEVEIEEYTHCGIGEIEGQIKKHCEESGHDSHEDRKEEHGRSEEHGEVKDGGYTDEDSGGDAQEQDIAPYGGGHHEKHHGHS